MAKKNPPSPDPTDLPDTTHLSYEQAIEQLEQIIDQIEVGTEGIEQSLDLATSGMKLISHCRGILNRAEKRIAELTVDEDGELESS